MPKLADRMTAPTLTIDEAVARFARLFTRAKRQHAAKLRREHKFKRKEK